MSALFNTYKTDSNAEVNGVDYPSVTNADGSQVVFILARSGKNNVAYRRALDKAAAPHRRVMNQGRMPEEVAEAMLLDLFAVHILKGWRNVQCPESMTEEFGVAAGEDIPYNKRNVIKLMTILPDLYTELVASANDMSLFVEGQREDEAKNL